MSTTTNTSASSSSSSGISYPNNNSNYHHHQQQQQQQNSSSSAASSNIKSPNNNSSSNSRIPGGGRIISQQQQQYSQQNLSSQWKHIKSIPLSNQNFRIYQDFIERVLLYKGGVTDDVSSITGDANINSDHGVASSSEDQHQQQQQMDPELQQLERDENNMTSNTMPLQDVESQQRDVSLSASSSSSPSSGLQQRQQQDNTQNQPTDTNNRRNINNTKSPTSQLQQPAASESFSLESICMDIYSHLTLQVVNCSSAPSPAMKGKSQQQQQGKASAVAAAGTTTTTIAANPLSLQHVLVLLTRLTRNCKEIWCTDMNLLTFLLSILQKPKQHTQVYILSLSLLKHYLLNQHISLEAQEVPLLIETVARFLLTLKLDNEQQDIEESQKPLIPHIFAIVKQLIRFHLIPQQALVPLCGAFCQTIFYPSLTHLTIVHAFGILKDSFIGRRAFQIMLDIMNFSPYISFYRGAVYFVGMVSWGTERVPQLQVNYSVVLRAMLRVLSSNDMTIAYEVILNIRRLVKKYGQSLTIEWDIISQILERIKKIKHLAPSNSEKLTEIDNTLHETLHASIKCYNEGSFFGDETAFITLLSDCVQDETFNSFALDYYADTLHPANQTWLRDWSYVFSTYFEDTKHLISDATKKRVLDLFFSQLTQFASLSGEELLGTAFPFLQQSLLSSHTATKIRSSIVLLLKNIAADIRLTSRTFSRVISLIASTTMDQHNDPTSQVSGISALTELLQLKFDKLPCSEAPVIFNHLVAAVPHPDSTIRKKALNLLLSLRSNSLFHLAINGISSPYLLCHSSDEPRRLTYVLPVSTLIEEVLSRILLEDQHEILQKCLLGMNDILLNSFLLKDFHVSRIARSVIERTRRTIEKLDSHESHLETFMSCLTVISNICGYTHMLESKALSDIIETLIASLSAVLRVGQLSSMTDHISRCIQIFTICVHETPHNTFENIGLIFDALRSIREHFEDNLPEPVLISIFSFLHNVGIMAPKKYRTAFVQETFSFSLTFCRKKNLHFVRLFAYQVLMQWFTNCSFTTRQALIRMSMETLYSEMKEGHSSLAETTMDFLLKFTFLSCEQSFDMSDQLANMFNNQQYKAWSLGNGVLTAQVGKFGHVLLRYRRPTGTIAWTMKLVNTIHHTVMKDEQYDDIPEYFNKFPVTATGLSASDSATLPPTNLSLSTKMSISPLIKQDFASISESDPTHLKDTSIHSDSESPNNSYFDPVVSSFEDDHDEFGSSLGTFRDQHDSYDVSSTEEHPEISDTYHNNDPVQPETVENSKQQSSEENYDTSLAEDWGPLSMHQEIYNSERSSSEENHHQTDSPKAAEMSSGHMVFPDFFHMEEHPLHLEDEQQMEYTTSLAPGDPSMGERVTPKNASSTHEDRSPLTASARQVSPHQASHSLKPTNHLATPVNTPQSTPLIQRRRSRSTPDQTGAAPLSIEAENSAEPANLSSSMTLPLSKVVESSVIELKPLQRSNSHQIRSRTKPETRSLKRSSSVRKRLRTPKHKSPKNRVISNIVNAIPPETVQSHPSALSSLSPKDKNDATEQSIVDTSVLHPNFPYLFLRNWTFFSQEPPCGLKSSKQLTRALAMFDLISPHETIKIGLVYRAEKQETQSEMLANTYGSSRYFEFLKEVGSFEPLYGMHPMYAGGLDTSEDKLDGEHTITHRDEINHITFHVSTLMPNDPHDQACSNKLKHIGNDYVIVVYSDNLSDLPINTFGGEFCIIQIIIFPLENGLNKVQVKIKEKWRSSLPPASFLTNSHIVSDQALPKFIRVACVHADMATRSMRHERGQYMSNWQHRLRQIRQIKTRFSSEKSSVEEFESAMRDLFDE